MMSPGVQKTLVGSGMCGEAGTNHCTQLRHSHSSNV